MVGWFHGMLLLSAKCSRPLGRWENTLWETIWRTISRTDHSVRSNGWIFSDLCKRPVKASTIWWESLARNILRVRIGCVWNLEGRNSGCRHWGGGTIGRIRNPRSKAQSKGRLKRATSYSQSQTARKNCLEEIINFENQIVVTMNLEMYQGLLTLIWTSRKRNVSMTIGMSIRTEACQILGKVSRSLVYWKKNHPKDICGPGGDWQTFKRLPDQIMYARSVDENW